MQRHFMINLAGLYAVTNHVKRMDTSTKETFTFVVIYNLLAAILTWAYFSLVESDER